MTEICEVIITAPDSTWLSQFARQLVKERLCAGAHEVSVIESTYRWNNEIVNRLEARVALHTRLQLVPQIVARTDAEHPYQIPCVVALPIIAANPKYAAWVITETSSISE